VNAISTVRDGAAPSRAAADLVRLPGRVGVKACIVAVFALPVARRAAALAEVRARRPGRDAWQAALVVSWLAHSFVVRDAAAGNHATLLGWFADADLQDVRLPFLKPYVLSEPPDEQTLFRGVCGDAVERAARGLNWTTDRRVAACFAEKRRAQGGAGRMLIVRRRVQRDELVAQFLTGEREAIVSGPGPARLECDAARRIKVLASRLGDVLAEGERAVRRLMTIPEEELWEGWGGPEGAPERAGAAG
jgi:hypothetical protein